MQNTTGKMFVYLIKMVEVYAVRNKYNFFKKTTKYTILGNRGLIRMYTLINFIDQISSELTDP